MKRITNGALVMAIGGLHEVVGLLTGAGLIAPPGAPRRNLLGEIAREGFVGAVERDPTRNVFFWFFFFGLVLLLLGWLMHAVERSGQRVPTSSGWQLGALAVAGGLLIPASGFWLALPVAWRIVRAGGLRDATSRRSCASIT
jgi:hypothetical protein